MDKYIQNLKDLIEVQKQSADYDEYMRGMANGLICALSVATGEEPQYVEWKGKPNGRNATK